MGLHPKQIQGVLRLSGHERYLHFVKVVADKQKCWGLYNDGWALAQDDDGNMAFLLWPESEYAALCAIGDWSAYEPKELDLDDLMDWLLPDLQEKNTLLGIFPTPEEQGVTPDFARFESDMSEELEKYKF